MQLHARVVLVTAALAIVGAGASVAHDPKDDLARMQQEIEVLRVEKNRYQDDNLLLSRSLEFERTRVTEEAAELRKQRAHDQRELAFMQERLQAKQNELEVLYRERDQAERAAAGAPALPIDGPFPALSLNDSPMQEVIAEMLPDFTGLRYAGQGVEGLTVRLRFPKCPVHAALDLLVRNARNPAGEWVDLHWSQGADGVITIKPR